MQRYPCTLLHNQHFCLFFRCLAMWGMRDNMQGMSISSSSSVSKSSKSGGCCNRFLSLFGLGKRKKTDDFVVFDDTASLESSLLWSKDGAQPTSDDYLEFVPEHERGLANFTSNVSLPQPPEDRVDYWVRLFVKCIMRQTPLSFISIGRILARYYTSSQHVRWYIDPVYQATNESTHICTKRGGFYPGIFFPKLAATIDRFYNKFESVFYLKPFSDKGVYLEWYVMYILPYLSFSTW